MSMRIDIALTPAEFGRWPLAGRAALVIDVLRASTSVIAACAAGCRRVIPVADVEAAYAAARAWAGDGAVLAGERGGDPLVGFDLGNSPLEFTPERVGGRTVILTTTNGTAAMTVAGGAAVVAIAALTNAGAAARWALAHGRDLIVLCAGDRGTLALEDMVGAGFIIDALASATPVAASDAATAARRLAVHYAGRLEALAEDAGWARRLSNAGRGADLDACLVLDCMAQVPVLASGVIEPGRASLTAAGAGHDTDGRQGEAPVRSARPETRS
jgi:2-phosphosulfolactate phosphatase